MKIAFADSSFYVALFIARDVNHAKAKVATQSWTGSTLTTERDFPIAATEVSATPASPVEDRAIYRPVVPFTLLGPSEALDFFGLYVTDWTNLIPPQHPV